MKMEQILIPESVNNSDDLYNVVYSNSKMMAYLLAKGIKSEEIHPVAIASYYVDYYFSQVNGAGLSKFVHASEWNSDINDRIAYGLKEMRSFKHLEYFSNMRKEINEIPSDKLEEYLEDGYYVDHPLRIAMDEDKTFYNIDDEIVDLNGEWLKGHKDVKVLPMDDIFLAIEEMVGEPIQR